MTNNLMARSLVTATMVIAALASGTAVLADDDSNNNESVRITPFGFGTFGGMNMMALPIDYDLDGAVSASEASLHASTGFSLLDGDADGQISEDEYLDSAPAALPRGSRNVERLYLNRRARFAAMDADNDSNVTLAEFMATAQASHEAADADGDGTVAVWEFRMQQSPF